MSTASSTSASPRPTCSTRARAALHERKAAWAPRGHGVHVPQPGPVHGSEVAPSRAPDASSSVPARISPTQPRRVRRAPRARSRGTRGPTTTRRCATACGRSAGGYVTRGIRAVVFADDNSIVDREVAYLAGIGWFGKNANLLIPGAGSWFVLGCVVTTAEYPVGTPLADGCGSCRRCLDGCPTGAIVAPGVVDANRCLAWLVQQPGTFPLEYRETLGDRFYGCDDCQTVCPPTVRHGRHHTVALGDDAQAWVDVLDVLDATGRGADRALRPVVPRRPRSALVAAQRADRARQHGDGRRPPDRRDHRPLPERRPIRSCASTPTGLPPGVSASTRPDRPASSDAGDVHVKHLLVTNDFPPKIGGIQSLLWEWWRRLPPDSFAVLTSPYRGAAKFDAAQPFQVERIREPVLLPHPLMVRTRRRDGARGRRRARRARPGDPARADRTVARPAVRRRAARRRGHGARAGSPVRSRRSATCCAVPAT